MVIRSKRILSAAFLLIFVAGMMLAAAQTVQAQGCVMCQTSASAAGKRGERALDEAILVLLIPPLILFVAILLYARRRNQVISNVTAKKRRLASATDEPLLHFSWSFRPR